jgi:2-oxopent-4-enoate/cis-2-oxohex-4-enoate hydratase
MALKADRIAALGDELFTALHSRSVLAPLTEREPGIDIEDAYKISLRFLERRTAEGERVVGKKIGVTSKPVQDMLGVHQPDFGFLTDRMWVGNGDVIGIAESGLIQPRAEGEIAFVLKKDLKGPGVSEDQVLDATDYVLPCFEIVDSRIRDWKIRIQDTVADNASCGVFVVGDDRVKPHALDLAAVKMDISKNGAHVASGLGSAVQGHPATAVAWLANTLGRYGIPFLKGEIILSGSLAPLLPAVPGDRFHMTLAGIGEASIGFEA